MILDQNYTSILVALFLSIGVPFISLRSLICRGFYRLVIADSRLLICTNVVEKVYVIVLLG